MTVIADRYDLAERIGYGAMGDVYPATDLQSGQTVAVKRLKSTLLQGNPDLLTRFQREGEALRDLNHPNIVKLLDITSHEGEHYLIMEYIRGGDLKQRIEINPGGLPVDEVLNIALDTADALTRAHRLGIIHRDLKPANILIAQDGTPRLTDFGIALYVEGERLTDTNEIIGTMDYVPPEVINGEVIDTRADVWSFGVTLFEMLAGHRPFRGDNLIHLFANIVSQPAPDLEALRPDCPVGLVDLIYRMMVKDPQGRIQSIRRVGAEIEALLTGADYPEPPRMQTGQFDTPLPRRTKSSTNLPAIPTPFIGRERELSTIIAQMDECRLLTLLGPGGMGKTRLSIEAASRLAERYERGAHFVALAPISSSDQIVPTIAEAVEFQFIAGGQPQQQLLDFLREKEILLLLDNFEHVMDGAMFVSDMLDYAPHIKVLVTSRERLKVSAECVFDVQGLQTPSTEKDDVFEEYEAVKMFVTYARRVNPGYELSDEDKPAIVQICRLVDGMPLAIELAAGWARSLSPQEVADELEKDLDILSTELANVPERQRSMRAAFDYSWRYLTDDERDAFMKFSVFRGGATRQAVRAVTEASMHILTSLVDKSMLRRDTASTRFEVHDLLRQFGEQRLSSSGMRLSVRDAHSDYYTDLVAALEPSLIGHGQLDALRTIGSNKENVNAAFLWAASSDHSEWVGRAINGISLYYRYSSQYPDGERLFERVVSILRTQLQGPPLDLIARLITRQAVHILLQDRVAEAQKLLHVSLPAARVAGDRWEEAYILHEIGYSQWVSNYPDEKTLDYAEQSAAIFEELDDAWGIWMAYDLMGQAKGALGDYAEGFAIHRRNLQLVRARGDRVGEASTLNNLAHFEAWVSGDYSAAIPLMESALSIAREFKNTRLIQMLQGNLGSFYTFLGHYETAEVYIMEQMSILADLGMSGIAAHWRLTRLYHFWGKEEQAQHHAERIIKVARGAQDRLYLMRALEHLQLMAFDAGDLKMAYGYAREAEAVGIRDRNFWGLDMNLGEIAAATGGVDRAWHHFRRVLEHAYRTEDPGNRLIILSRIPAVLSAGGRPVEAAEILSFVINQPGLISFWKERAQRLLDAIQAQTAPDIFEAAMERGRALDLDTVVQRLLDEELQA